ncbi:MAG: hypothetical protein OXR62_10430 [Ahrensia sp.]|nr:hypothetical protein [Ahrensia sp.]
MKDDKLIWPDDKTNEEIIAAALSDPDAQPWDGKGKVVHARDVPEKVARLKKATEEGFRKWRADQEADRGMVRLDPDVLAHFQKGGDADVQRLVNDTLRKVMEDG